jgi:nucleotide-binding universal stress UspA family protein
MDSILCLIDYGADREQPFLYGQHLAAHLHADIIAGHLVEGASNLIIENEQEARATPELAQSLNQLQDLIRRTPGAPALPKCLVASGNPREQVIHLIEKYEAGLVVMGMRNRKGLTSRLFGSFALRIIHEVSCPIFLLPPGATFQPLQTIVYATEFGYANLAAIETLLQWSQLFNAHLHLVHVNYDAADHAWAKQQMEKIRRTFEEEDDDRQMTFKIIDGEDVVEHLQQYIQEVQANLIALTVYHKGFWDRVLRNSISREIVEDVSIPVLVFKE